MKKLLMMFLILSSGCGTLLELRKDPEIPESKPYYHFEILTNEEGAQRACLNTDDTQKLWEELKTCRGDN